MSKTEYFLRHSLIVNKLATRPLNFEEITDYLEYESELQGYNFVVSKRTFQRDLVDIRTTLQIDIQFNPTRKVYHIVGNLSELSDTSTNRMLEAYDMLNALNLSDNLKDYIQFEQRRPTGSQHFSGLLHAIKNCFLIELNHQGFWKDLPTVRIVRPLMLKESRERWYLLAEDDNDRKTKPFGLDRILDFVVTKKKFKKDTKKELKDWFQNCFGVIKPEDEKPEIIILSFSVKQGKYAKTYPLHGSQKVLIDNEKEYRIQLELYITEDLIMELLSYGWDLTIVSPEKLRTQVKEILEGTLCQYDE